MEKCCNLALKLARFVQIIMRKVSKPTFRAEEDWNIYWTLQSESKHILFEKCKYK